MLRFLVGLMLYSFWTALFINFIVLFGMRIFFVFKHKTSATESIKILFMPFSIGYLLSNNDNNLFNKIYKGFIWLLFLTTAIGTVMVFYTHFV